MFLKTNCENWFELTIGHLRLESQSNEVQLRHLNQLEIERE